MDIGVDFDGTFAADPETFREVVRTFQRAGHKPVLVTGRPSSMGDEVRRLVGDLMPIVFADGMPKREAAKRRGFNVQVWIDDNPASIDEGFMFIGGARVIDRRSGR